jgi:hypothetical protein
LCPRLKPLGERRTRLGAAGCERLRNVGLGLLDNRRDLLRSGLRWGVERDGLTLARLRRPPRP